MTEYKTYFKPLIHIDRLRRADLFLGQESLPTKIGKMGEKKFEFLLQLANQRLFF